jgi:hypothetical protein
MNPHWLPVPQHLASRIFARPTNSAVDGRVFSLAGNVLNDARHDTQEELARCTKAYAHDLRNEAGKECLKWARPLISVSQW